MAGFSGIGKLINIPIVIVVSILGVVLGLAVLAPLVPTYLENAASVGENLTTGTVGDPTGDAILGVLGGPVWGILAALGIFVVAIGVLVVAYKSRGV